MSNRKNDNYYELNIGHAFRFNISAKLKFGRTSYKKYSLYLVDDKAFAVNAGGIFSQPDTFNINLNKITLIEENLTLLKATFIDNINDIELQIKFYSEKDMESFTRYQNDIKHREKVSSNSSTFSKGSLLSVPRPQHKSYYAANNYQREYFVTGPYSEEVNKAVADHVKQHGNKPYGGQNKTKLKSVLKNYPRIYRFNSINSKKVKLELENDNQYDSNAVAVYFRNIKVGYIQKEYTTEVRNKLAQGLKPKAKIKGGPYVEIDDFENKVVENDSDYKILIDL